MSTDQHPSDTGVSAGRVKTWKIILLKAIGLGAGFALVAGLLLALIVWWNTRPKSWSDTAIAAKPTELYTRLVDEELHVEFHYAFTNNTSTEYSLPSAESGALMRHVPSTASVEKLDGATWDTTVRIPPRQSVAIVFSVPFRLSEFGTSSGELDTNDKLTEFMSRRLLDIKGMTFFDYAAKYRVEMADIRDALPKAASKAETASPKQLTKADKFIPPDKGYWFDKAAACEEADKLIERCRHANISSSQSPWVKYGGWPDKLGTLPTPPPGFTLEPTPDVCVTAAEWRNYCKANVK